MKTQVIYLDDYDWLIKVYYAIDTYYTDEILGELDSIDCEPEAFYKIAELLDNFTENIGFTYTDVQKHVTFIIIGLTSSAEEFMNTFIHEVGHATTHIAEYYDLDFHSEEIQYLQGDIALEMFDVAKEFLCEHCRDINFYNYGKMKIKIKKEG